MPKLGMNTENDPEGNTMSDLYAAEMSWMDEIDPSNQEEFLVAVGKRDAETFNGTLGIRFPEQTADRTVAEIDITPDLYQPFGFLHGGVTLALIEAAGSRAVELRADFSKERVFGVHMEIDHRKPGKFGTIRAIATFDRQEKNKQFWKIEVRDDEDDIVSEGTFITKIVSLERLAQKEAERAQK